VRGLLTAGTLDRGWRLAPQVALRPEPFGALAYHFGTRRLSFLKSRILFDVVTTLPIAIVAGVVVAIAMLAGMLLYPLVTVRGGPRQQQT
jgi:putative mycofactocin binding protein MftB